MTMAKVRFDKGARRFVDAEIEILPLMNLFIVLVPMLLLSAVFVQISVIEAGGPAPADAAPADAGDALDVAVRISTDEYVVDARGMDPIRIRRHRNGGVAEKDLGGALQSIRASHPENVDVRVVSEPTTRYEEIIAVMDISRDAGLSRVALLGTDTEAS
jgi:biopolymer transport protein ExbD